jgi:putative pyruvate formate lyase activating enzyme
VNRPVYAALAASGELARRAAVAGERLASCDLCPRGCGVDRAAGDPGFCGSAADAFVVSAFAHPGEEPMIRGSHGSGTLFVAHCNLQCSFCQNDDISLPNRDTIGRRSAPERIAALMLDLQSAGCHNINWVTPTHVLPQLLSALTIAAARGLRLPIVYNTGGYDSPAVLRELLDGVVDIYMPDVKTLDARRAGEWFGAPDYPDVVREALREMHRQVGDLTMDDAGIATRGLLVRHLVMPDALDDTAAIMRFIAGTISTQTVVNVMAQYRPPMRLWGVDGVGSLGRSLSPAEHRRALALAREAGLTRAIGDR